MNKITYEERKEIYEKALKTWGTPAQIMMALEEMSELTKELCKHFRGRPNGAEIIDEVADVTIMMEQLRLILGINEAVCEQMDVKMLRLKKRLGMKEEKIEKERTAKRYRKKPVEVLAVQFNGENKVEIQKFVGKYLDQTVKGLIIPTLEGDHIASAGDYIIRGVNGEFYPCKPDIFWKTYETVGDGENVDGGLAGRPETV